MITRTTFLRALLLIPLVLFIYFITTKRNTQTPNPSLVEETHKTERLPAETKTLHSSDSTVIEEEEQTDLASFLPQWLKKNGTLFQDQREIDGHVVLRSRGRQEWENGERLEIEITDIGEHPDESLLKSLGFNLALQNEQTDSGHTLVKDEGDVLINQEYDENDQSGSMQLLIKDRYLIEIQIQSLPEDSFQEVLDIDLPFDEIFSR